MSKYCTACQYCIVNKLPKPLCRHPSNINPVDGTEAAIDCDIMRAPGGKCGTEGRLFYLCTREPPGQDISGK